MGRIATTYSETENKFYRIVSKLELKLQTRRRLLGSSLRYCIDGLALFLPTKDVSRDLCYQLCWASIDSISAMELPANIGEPLPDNFNIHEFVKEGFGSVRIGNRYIKRRVEKKDGMIDVESFCAKELMEAISSNPEAITRVDKTDFESLCAEIFVKRGFKVDLFRPTKDDGIDFLALKDDNSDPIVFAVQCKLPDILSGKRIGKTTGVATIREIFGVATAFNFDGAVAITGSKFSSCAHQFADLKKDKIYLHDLNQLQEWIQKYRWNEDETTEV